MSYYRGDAYRGDYYRGDYYRGDPGLFSFLGKAARGLAGVVTGGASEKLLGLIPTFRATKPPPPGPMRAITAGLGGTGPGSLVQYEGANGHATFGPTMPGGGGQNLPAPIGGRHRALHWNRETYITRGGGTSRWPAQLLVHPKGTEAVPSRRMNVGNARALRHALHRISGFARLAKRVMHFAHPARHTTRFKFPKRKKR